MTVASRTAFLALALFCAIVTIAVVRHGTAGRPASQTARQTKRSSAPLANNKMRARNMVGGYSTMDAGLLRSEDVLEMAAFALSEHAAGSSNFEMTSLAATPEEVEGGTVRVQVLGAQRQVVAGMNYRLTLAVLRDGACLGGFEVTVYRPLPYMEEGPSVASWGRALKCADVEGLMEAAKAGEEGKALAVEQEIQEEREDTEPDA